MTEAVGEGQSRLTVEAQRFAVVPEWIIDSDIGDAAFRLYAVLLRYGQSSGKRMPSRATLARRMRKRSVDTVDRAMRELVAIGAVVVERRTDGRRQLTNLYHVRTSGPGRERAAAPTDAAPPGPTSAVTPAATVRLDPEVLTQSTPPPIRSEDIEAVRELRKSLGRVSVLMR
jgi:DNA-binding transcriptional MocR family regulator